MAHYFASWKIKSVAKFDAVTFVEVGFFSVHWKSRESRLNALFFF